jgi:glyoxylase-like metal-dependent hydrolase (beta-lactamase superfamily II)
MAERYISEVPGVPIVLPTLTVDDELTLYRGRRTIEIKYLGRGHTHGDLVVHLPQEHVVITGDLVVAPVPLIGADQSFVGDWSATLDKLRGLRATTLVPGHGPVLHDDTYLQLFGRMLASAKQQTDAAIARGETIEQARQSVHLDEFRKAMAGDDRELNLLFSNYAQGPAIGAVYREVKGKQVLSVPQVRWDKIGTMPAEPFGPFRGDGP